MDRIWAAMEGREIYIVRRQVLVDSHPPQESCIAICSTKRSVSPIIFHSTSVYANAVQIGSHWRDVQ